MPSKPCRLCIYSSIAVCARLKVVCVVCSSQQHLRFATAAPCKILHAHPLKLVQSVQSLELWVCCHRYSAIVLDEAHERSIHLDLLLGHLKSEAHNHPDLKICVTSATMDTDRFCSFLHGAPLLEIPGRVYPVAVRYMPTPDSAHGLDWILRTVGAVLRILDDTAVHYEANTAYQAPSTQHSKGGDMLVFMTTPVRHSHAAKDSCTCLRNSSDVHTCIVHHSALQASQAGFMHS